MNTVTTQTSVRNTYAVAAQTPQPGLCCPKDYPEEWADHIPNEAFSFSYGCGSPVLKSQIRKGEHVVDLGSGVGIDCFVAARLVGANGRVSGIDMTDEMLDKARHYARIVGDRLGYHNIDFAKGVIEEIPLDSNSVDVVISNCVLNLSSDKKAVLAEIKRVLKPSGRLVIADIVSDREVSTVDQANPKLWGDCYSGALSAKKFIAAFRDAGFTGITQISESPWKSLAGYRFSSLTVAGYNMLKGPVCQYMGQTAIYLGPYSQVEDDAGHIFPRFQPVEVCTDTAIHLKEYPYTGSFLITGATRRDTSSASSCCSPDSGCGCN